MVKDQEQDGVQVEARDRVEAGWGDLSLRVPVVIVSARVVEQRLLMLQDSPVVR